MSLSFTLEENCLFAEISGEIDHHSAKTLRDEIDKACDKYLPARLCIDLTELSFMDSSGIGLVLGRYQYMKRKGRDTVAVVPQGKIRQILIMAATDRFVRLYEKREDI